MLHSHRMELFACRASDDFARRVIEELNVIRNSDEPVQKLGALSVTQFEEPAYISYSPRFRRQITLWSSCLPSMLPSALRLIR